jgi:hypothetical protein
MERHGVLAVLSGHIHLFDHTTRGGVDYIVTGAAAAPTAGPGIPNEYLDITIDSRSVMVRRIPTGAPSGNTFSHAVRAFRFTAELNRDNHIGQGWNYVPSAGVQLTGALRRTRYRGAKGVAFFGAASVEHNMGASGRLSAFGDLGISLGQHELAGHLGVGYRVRPLGSWNRNVYLSGAATANAGWIAGRSPAGLGVQPGIGVAWHGFTVELSRSLATNHGATAIAVGRRF